MARRIWELRRAAKLSQTALGERVGVSQSLVSAWETGEIRVRDEEHFERLAEVLGAEKDELVLLAYRVADDSETELRKELTARLGRLEETTQAILELLAQTFPEKSEDLNGVGLDDG